MKTILRVAFFLVWLVILLVLIPFHPTQNDVYIESNKRPNLGFNLNPISAQGSNTVYQQVGTNVDASFESTPVRNIGQPYHIAIAVFHNAPGHTCTAVSGSAQSFNIPQLDIEASADNVHYFIITNYTRAITPSSSAPGNTYRMISSAAGAFPFVQITLGNFDDTNCRADVFYSGSLAGLDIKKYVDYGTGSDKVQVFIIDTNADATIVSSAGVNVRIVVYGWQLFNTTSQTVDLIDVRPDATSTYLQRLNTWCTGCSESYPNTNFPLWNTSMGGSLFLHVTGGTRVSGFVQFRYE
jgi:hypothetical protein